MSVVVVVLTIAGLSFNLLSQHHFEVLDRQALVEKLESTKKIFNNVRSSANLAEELPQLRALLGAHHDLAATILSEDGRVLFSDPKTVDVPESYGWSEVAMHFRLTSASADFESGKPIKNDQITSSFRCF